MSTSLKEGDRKGHPAIPANSATQINLLEKQLSHLITQNHNQRLIEVEPFSSIDNFLQSFRYVGILSRLYREAVRFYLLPHDNVSMAEFRNVFVGMAFQGAALDYAQRVTPERNVLVKSNPRLVDLYHMMYPNAQIVSQSLGRNSLLGISVTDALELGLNKDGKPEAKKAYEASLADDEEDYRRHYIGFLRRKIDFPSIFRDSELVFLAPQQSHLPDDINVDPAVKIWELPIGRVRFSYGIKRLIKRFRYAKDSATLSYMQTEARYQHRRAWDHLNTYRGILRADAGIDPEELYLQRIYLRGKSG